MRRLLLALLLAAPLWAAQQNAFRTEVLVDGFPAPEYVARGTTYIEAIQGKEYEIRLTNPLPIRVAVALSVDGLNSIDARHTDARSARKWVLDPYESITIRGWQTNDRQARRFFFTTESNSYGRWLGRTENLGVITAVFFRERVHYGRRIQPMAPGEPSPRAESRERDSAGAPAAKSAPQAQDEYAATGIGDREEHPVTRVWMDLEEQPAAVMAFRYEFRPALVALGILPAPSPVTDPLRRRERSRGFRDTGFCPDPR